MVNRKVLAIAKERYEQEFDRRGHLISIVGIYSAGLSVLVFIIWNMYISFPLGLSITHLIIYALGILLVTLIVLIIVNLFKFFLRQTYLYLPVPSKVQEYVQKLDSYFDQNYEEFFKEKDSKNTFIERRLCENLLESYTACALHNHFTNNLRATRIHKIGYYLLMVITILVISLIPYWLLTTATKCM